MMKKSFWLDCTNKKNFPKLQRNEHTEILIIGGGITGILLAYHLQNYFDNIILLEQNKLYHGTTGHTTAKVTAQHGYLYYDLINMHNTKIAKEYYEANQKAVDYLKELVTKEQIDCDLKICNATLYAMNEEEIKLLKNEEQAYQILGIPYLKEGANLGFKTSKSIKLEDQVSFNVVKFLDQILERIDNNKVKIYEHTKVKKTILGDKLQAITIDDFVVNAKQIINASHYPFYKSFNFYFTKLVPSISYAVVAKKNDNIKIDHEMFINVSKPVRSLRYIYQGDEEFILLAGNSRDTSDFSDFEQDLRDLKEFGRNHFQIDEYLYEWYTQDYQVTDYIPFIGRIKDTNMYMATGFNKWGMSHSILASLMITDLIVKGGTKYQDLFNPSRKVLFAKTLSYNLKMVKTFVKTKLINQIKNIELKQNEGKIDRINGKKYGFFKDENNKIYIVKPVCPHLGCSLLYNNVSKTYDCACHGSRFKYDGTCIDGPANKNLETYKLKGD